MSGPLHDVRDISHIAITRSLTAVRRR